MFPISFLLYINISQEEDPFYWRWCNLLHVTTNISAASYRKIKYLKNTTSQAQKPYWTHLVYTTVKCEYIKVGNIVDA